jgi:ankyrin repeat protein
MGCSESRTQEKSGPTAGAVTMSNQFVIYGAIVTLDTATIEQLLTAGFIINFKMPNFAKRTALHIAAEKGIEKMIVFLIGKGADPNIADPLGVTPVLLAAQNKHIKSVLCLANLGADLNVRTNNGHSFSDYASDSDKKVYKKYLGNSIKSLT